MCFTMHKVLLQFDAFTFKPLLLSPVFSDWSEEKPLCHCTTKDNSEDSVLL